MARDGAPLEVGGDVGGAPAGERADLDHARVPRVGADLRHLGAARRLVAAQAGDPGVEGREHPAQRHHLACPAAGEAVVDRAAEEVGAEAPDQRLDVGRIGQVDLDLEAVMVADLIDEAVGLDRQAAGVDGEDPHPRIDAHRQVEHHHPLVLEGGADRDAPAPAREDVGQE